MPEEAYGGLQGLPGGPAWRAAAAAELPGVGPRAFLLFYNNINQYKADIKGFCSFTNASLAEGFRYHHLQSRNVCKKLL